MGESESQLGHESDPSEEILHIHDLASEARGAIRAGQMPPDLKEKAIDDVDELERLALKRYPEVNSYVQQKEDKKEDKKVA